MAKHTMTIKLTAALAILSVMFISSGCQREKINNLNEELTKTSGERDNLKDKLQEATVAYNQLRKDYDKLVSEGKKLQLQINELTSSRDTVQMQVQKLTVENETMKGLIADLTKTNDAATDIAKESQKRVIDLVNELDAQKKKVAELEWQLKNVQSAFKEFQDKIKM